MSREAAEARTSGTGRAGTQTQPSPLEAGLSADLLSPQLPLVSSRFPRTSPRHVSGPHSPYWTARSCHSCYSPDGTGHVPDSIHSASLTWAHS